MTIRQGLWPRREESGRREQAGGCCSQPNGQSLRSRSVQGPTERLIYLTGSVEAHGERAVGQLY